MASLNLASGSFVAKLIDARGDETGGGDRVRGARARRGSRGCVGCSSARRRLTSARKVAGLCWWGMSAPLGILQGSSVSSSAETLARRPTGVFNLSQSLVPRNAGYIRRIPGTAQADGGARAREARAGSRFPRDKRPQRLRERRCSPGKGVPPAAQRIDLFLPLFAEG